MRATIDTNVLVRVLTNDDPVQAQKAAEFLQAHVPIVTNQVFCELVWVLVRLYRFSRPELAEAIKAIMHTKDVIFDETAVISGLNFLEGGGDFADAIIAVEGDRFHAETLATFDRDAAQRFSQQRRACILLTEP